ESPRGRPRRGAARGADRRADARTARGVGAEPRVPCRGLQRQPEPGPRGGGGDRGPSARARRAALGRRSQLRDGRGRHARPARRPGDHVGAPAEPRGVSAGDSAVDTPMMQQYRELKRRFPDHLLLFRLGDFYELFLEDAELGARLLSITLTSRQGSPMAGIPHHSADGYIARLVQAGQKIAICEQMEAPGKGKKLLKRAVVRVITPGTLTDTAYLSGCANNYLLAVATQGGAIGVALLDVSTGEFVAGEDAEPEGGVLAAALLRRPSEILVSEALAYARSTQGERLGHLVRLGRLTAAECLTLDETAVETLELLRAADGSVRNSLVGVLDETVTPMGARLLRQWLLQPLRDPARIRERQDALGVLVTAPETRAKLRALLRGIGDLERLSSRATLGVAHARDLVALRGGLAPIDGVRAACAALAAPLVEGARAALADLDDLRALLEAALVDEPPLTLSDGGVIRETWHEALHAIVSDAAEARRWIAGLEERERAKTGLSSLRVRFNRVFGYGIEVSHAQSG